MIFFLSEQLIFKKDQFIYKEGQETDGLYFINDGILRLSTTINYETDELDLNDNLTLHSEKNNLVKNYKNPKKNSLDHAKVITEELYQPSMFGYEEILEKHEKR